MSPGSQPCCDASPFPRVELGELVEFRRGLTYGKSDEVEFSSTAVLRANNVDLASGELDLSEIRYISDEVQVPRSKKLIANSLLICTASGSRSHLGKMAHVSRELDFAFGGFMGLLVPRSELSPKYLWYFSRSSAYREHLESMSPGANINNLRFDDLARLALPLPPLDEQKRIVAALDQAFAALDRARANVEKNLSQSRGLFLSALRDVFANSSAKWSSGEAPPPLAGEHREQPATRARDKSQTRTGGRDATTRPIEGPYSLSVLKPQAVARQGWLWAPLSSLAALESGHTPSRRHPEYWGGDLGWVGIKDARDHHGGTIWQTREQTNPLGISNSSARLLPVGTVCLSRTASLGYVVKLGAEMATSQDFVNWICGPDLEPDFLVLILLAQGDDISRFASGSVHHTIYFPEAKAFWVCHPCQAVQSEIVRSMSCVRDQALSLERNYSAQLSDIDSLRQSLLQAAFSGQLS